MISEKSLNEDGRPKLVVIFRQNIEIQKLVIVTSISIYKIILTLLNRCFFPLTATCLLESFWNMSVVFVR